MRLRLAACRLLLITWLALLTGCASMPGTVEIPRERLQAALERRFPFEARPAGGLFLVRVADPRLKLLPADNRLRVDFTVEASDRITGRAGRGALALSFGIRYEPSDTTLRATGVRAENVEVQGLSPEWRAPLQLAGALVAENLLEGAVLNTFRAEDLARANGRTPGDIRVTPTGVRIALVPPSAALPARAAAPL